MARPIILSNSQMHVGINKTGLVHDFYFPHVGFENHASGPSSRHRVGVWVDGQFSWLDASEWSINFSTSTHALVGHTSATNHSLGIILEFTDFVNANTNAFVRLIHVINMRNTQRNVRLFMHQAFKISNSGNNTDTAQYLPDSNAILHYRGKRAFVISGYDDQENFFDQHSIGLFGIENHEGTHKDAEDGELGCGNVEHGQVDSVLRFSITVPAYASKRVSYWIAAGLSPREALDVHKHVMSSKPQELLINTVKWWQAWLQPTLEFASQLEGDRKDLFIHSAMVLKAHCDKDGAIIASTDSAMLNYARDNYAYSWPRDGAYIVWPLIRLGYTSEALTFFRFCKNAFHPQGYLMHKYRADGALGSSWHPYVHGEINAPPIQEDETALVLFMFLQLFDIDDKEALIEEFYEDFIKPAADFLASYIDRKTGLPKPSYDLWEELFITTTYSVSTVYAGLSAAAELAESADKQNDAVQWRSIAEAIRESAHRYLYNSERKAFYKGISFVDSEPKPDPTIDMSSFFGAFMYGLYPVDSQEIISTAETIVNTFGPSYGNSLPRYENDNYRRESTEPNPWFITSLWMAQYYIESHRVEKAEEILKWVEGLVDKSKMLSEQLSAIDSQPRSVSPLAWSHAEYMATVLDYHQLHKERSI